MTSRVLVSVAAMAAGLLLAGGVQAANLVADSNFDGPSGGGSFTTYFSGSTFGPWTVGSGSVDLIGGYWQAPVGGGSVDLDGNNPGQISQTLTLGKTGTYDLSFYLSGNPDGGASTKTVDVSVGGASHAYSFTTGANSHGAMRYVPETLTFTANAGQVTLAFASADGSSSPFGPVIGGVSVVASAVPEPTAWALMLVGFAGLGSAVRLRRRSAAALA